MERIDELIQLGATCAEETNGQGMQRASAELLAFAWDDVDLRFQALSRRRMGWSSQAMGCFRVFHELYRMRLGDD